MIAYLIAVFLLVITPGPGVLSTAGVGAAYGYTSGVRYVLGLFIGNNLVALMVITGLAAVVLANPAIRTFLLIISSAYLFYLAYKIAFSGSQLSFINAKQKLGINAGIFLQIVNPKAYVVNTTLFTGFAFAPQSLLFETTVKLLILNVLWIPVHLLWLYLGSSLHKLNLAPTTQRRINQLMALSLITVVILAIITFY